LNIALELFGEVQAARQGLAERVSLHLPQEFGISQAHDDFSLISGDL
jgi:hypothetical protein